MPQQWSFIRNEEECGPVSGEQLRQMIERGELTSEDLVWCKGMTSWVPAASVPELSQPVHGPAAAVSTATITRQARASTGMLECTPRAVQFLQQTAPWAKFVSVILLLTTIVAFLLALFLLANSRPGMADAARGVLMLVGSIVYGTLAVYLNRFASGIDVLRTDRRPAVLERVLDAQRAFWRLFGMVMLVMLVFYAVVAIVVVVAARS